MTFRPATTTKFIHVSPGKVFVKEEAVDLLLVFTLYEEVGAEDRQEVASLISVALSGDVDELDGADTVEEAAAIYAPWVFMGVTRELLVAGQTTTLGRLSVLTEAGEEVAQYSLGQFMAPRMSISVLER